MSEPALKSELITFRSLDEPEIENIHKRQNEDCTYEIASIFDFSPPWAPVTLEQLKEKIAEDRKRPRTAHLSLWSENNDFLGLAIWMASWDTWCPRMEIFIFPEHRRKGYGTEVARLLTDMSFHQNPGHMISTGVEEWNAAALEFIKSLGFKDAGRMRRTGIKDGEYYDTLRFDILKSEYEALRGGSQ